MAQRRLGETSEVNQKESIRLSSGDRIAKAAYDPSGLAISETMKSKIQSYSQAGRNTQDGISLLQVAEGGLTTISDLAIRMKELALQSANGTYSDSDRSFIDREFQSAKKEMTRIIQGTEFNGKKLLDGNIDYDIQVGIHNEKSTNRLTYELSKDFQEGKQLGVGTLRARNSGEARESLEEINSVIQKISKGRSLIGSVMNRMDSINKNISITKENLSASNSKIRDADFVQSTAEKAKAKINQSASELMMNVTSQSPRAVIDRLLS